MKILDGKLAAQAVKEKLKIAVEKLKAEGKKVPHLAAILIGDNGASATYVAAKVKACEETGFISTLLRFDTSITATQLLEKITELNKNSAIDGILVQLPLPAHIAEEEVIKAIDPAKDVDGFHPVNLGKMVQGQSGFIPATPYGIMLLLEHYQIETTGKNAVVIGRSNIVGRPMSILLSGNTPQGNCTVTLCHSRTKELETHCKQADIIVAALGKPEFLQANMIKKGAVVIDVGITRVNDNTKKSGFRLLGDVHFESVAPLCSWITPVPGGVGPMTIAALLKNTFQACQQRH
ncbi:MAG: bifunctional methylenetetrahydrofolate dehydrogenase/methenyltetrahydrofolate cyclohydrolase FolD [Bacteroidota bacterium]|jgi:methylenetetrahydrofolate dehydrogenase (NADP+)/methenyltetrahydrofolate cyclohydrolase|nr:bifunctional methylenetetrahydrofolate dehydrogenase/methenyltetrahydrofolate cyclohydrolase FolD [Terrimonas sp.]